MSEEFWDQLQQQAADISSDEDKADVVQFVQDELAVDPDTAQTMVDYYTQLVIADPTLAAEVSDES